MEKRRVVITGLGTVNPLGNTTAESWAAAKAGKCGIGPITQFDASEFKCKLAAEVKNFDPETVVDKKEARKMARFTLLALGAAAEALTDSGLDLAAEGEHIGVSALFDIYHQQISEGNVIRNITENIDMIGHFHIADNPGRNQPGTGELNYKNIFKAIQNTGYDRWLAFECGRTVEVPDLVRDMHVLIDEFR